MKILCLVLALSLGVPAAGAGEGPRGLELFNERYELFVPRLWQVREYPLDGELAFVSPKRSCAIHVMHENGRVFGAAERLDLIRDYQQGLRRSFGGAEDGGSQFKMSAPKAYSLNGLDGYFTDYVNFFPDGRYLSGRSLIFFGKERGSVILDLMSFNYKTRARCLADARKYIKTLRPKPN